MSKRFCVVKLLNFLFLGLQSSKLLNFVVADVSDEIFHPSVKYLKMLCCVHIMFISCCLEMTKLMK